MVNTDKKLDYRLFLQREEKFIRADYFAEFRQYNRIRNGDVDAVKERFEKVRPNYLNGKDGRGMLSQDPLRNSIYHLVSSAAIAVNVTTANRLTIIRIDSKMLIDFFKVFCIECSSF